MLLFVFLHADGEHTCQRQSSDMLCCTSVRFPCLPRVQAVLSHLCAEMSAVTCPPASAGITSTPAVCKALPAHQQTRVMLVAFRACTCGCACCTAVVQVLPSRQSSSSIQSSYSIDSNCCSHLRCQFTALVTILIHHMDVTSLQNCFIELGRCMASVVRLSVPSNLESRFWAEQCCVGRRRIHISGFCCWPHHTDAVQRILCVHLGPCCSSRWWLYCSAAAVASIPCRLQLLLPPPDGRNISSSSRVLCVAASA